MSKNSARRTALEIAGRCVAVRLRMLNRKVSGIFDEALRPLGLRVSQLNVLVAVAVGQPVSPAEISARLHLEKSTLSRNLERMARRGWLVVEPGRPNHLRLTRKGESLLDKALPPWERAQEESRRLLGSEGARAIHASGNRLWSEK